MEIIIPHKIRKKEFGGKIPEEAERLFAKIKKTPGLAVTLSAPELPSRPSLHKVYATTENGARRLLFFSRYPESPASHQPERWVLLFYRDKADRVGRNMSSRNPEFKQQLARNLVSALEDIAGSTTNAPRFDVR